jgi:hypothetical protein
MPTSQVTSAPKYGVFTPYTLQFHRALTGESPARFLKRAALLFEKLLFVPEGLGDLMDQGSPLGTTWYLDAIFDGSNPKTLKKFRQLFLRDHDVWSDHAEFLLALRDSQQNELWDHDSFHAWVERMLEVEVQNGALEDAPGARFERHTAYMSLSHDYKLLAAAR